MENLHLYEIVFLLLGIILFAILCGGLVYYIIKKEPIKKLLFFFPISIIMIGYPGIQELRIEGYKVSLTKYEKQLLENPEDEEVKQKLSKTARELEKRSHTTEDFMAVSRANILLEKPEKAIELANTALEIEKKESDKKRDIPKNKIIPSPGKDEGTSVNNNKVEELKELKKMAVIQQELKKSSETIKDTVKLNKKIQGLSLSNKETMQFFRKKYQITSDNVE